MVRAGFVALATLLLALTGGAGFAQAPIVSTLPGGASSLQETHQDWLVSCAQGEAAAHRCALSQTQTNQGGQRVLSLELTPDAAGRKANGTLILPFGLALAAGVKLQIDDGATAEALQFSTCLAVGCVVPVSFGDAALPFLRAGKKLNVHTQASDSSQEVVFPISLVGLAGALDRTLQLLPAN